MHELLFSLHVHIMNQPKKKKEKEEESDRDNQWMVSSVIYSFVFILSDAYFLAEHSWTYGICMTCTSIIVSTACACV